MKKHQLLILRHGKSDWPPGVPDRERPLKKRGKKNALRMGLWLVEQALLPDHIISSPAKRALATARKICDAIGWPYSRIEQQPLVYEADLSDLMSVLHGLPEQLQRVMLVGHNPGLEHLLIHLCPTIDIPDDGKLLPTACMAHLQIEHNWAVLPQDGARLLSITRAKSLPEEFPLATEQGTEWRERPAHHYSQAGVIPYRKFGGQLQILLVTSRRNRGWSIPKGIIEKNMSALESARQEALEEAGVDGRMSANPVGECEYSKWGGRCRLQVYAMEVDRVIETEQWLESWRDRQWVPAEKLDKYLQDPDIARQVAQFCNQLT